MIRKSAIFSILMLTVSHLCNGRSQFDLFSSSDAIPCIQICPSIYEPICGSDGKTYDNDCELENTGCELPSDAPALFKIANGECEAGTEPECPESCPDIYRPVCGSDGNVYNNECDLISAACKDPSIFKVAIDDCGTPSETPSCSDICPSTFRPVCGSDGNTYNNECQLTLAACRDPSIYKLADIDCEGTVTSFTSLQSSASEATPPDFSTLTGFAGPKESSLLGSSGLRPGPLVPARGDAESAPVTECPECEKQCFNNCGDEFSPVCGSDGITYNNGCFLQLAICKDPQLTKAADGGC